MTAHSFPAKVGSIVWRYGLDASAKRSGLLIASCASTRPDDILQLVLVAKAFDWHWIAIELILSPS